MIMKSSCPQGQWDTQSRAPTIPSRNAGNYSWSPATLHDTTTAVDQIILVGLASMLKEDCLGIQQEWLLLKSPNVQFAIR